jgi:hypothetical protein
LFGVYQPLLGWKSKRIEKRLESGLSKRAISLGKIKRQI